MDYIYDELAKSEPTLKFLFVTAEKLNSSVKLRETLSLLYKRGKLSRLVIDEAHCVSKWGNGFRPAYLKLNSLRENYQNVPIMAMTATATVKIITNVVKILGVSEPTM